MDLDRLEELKDTREKAKTFLHIMERLFVALGNPDSQPQQILEPFKQATDAERELYGTTSGHWVKAAR